MIKKWSSIFIIAVFIWSQLGLLSPKADSGFLTETNPDGLTITGYAGLIPDGDLVIPRTLWDGGVEKNVTAIKESAFSNRQLTSLTFEPASELVEIGEGAFAGNALGSVQIPSSVQKIGNVAFSVSQLTSLTFEPGSELVEIGIGAFTGNTLGNVQIPSSVQKIGDNAFMFSQLTSLTFESPSNLEEIGVSAFLLNELTSVTIPSSVQKIGNNAFQQNKLTSVSFEPTSNLTEIGDNAFSSTVLDGTWNNIVTITIPSSVTKIGESAFFGNKLTTVTFEEESHLEKIGNSAFVGNELESITFPSSINMIGHSAFVLNKLKTIEFKQPLNPPVTVDVSAFNFQDNNMSTQWFINGNIQTPWDQQTVTTALKVYSTPQTTHEVTFETNGGSTVNTEVVAAGELVTKPEDPTQDGYIFDGWYREDLQTLWNFATDPVTEPITLHAKWAAASPFTTSDNSDGTVKITGYNGTVPAELVIPAEINGKPVTVIGSSAFMFQTLTDVVIPEGVKRIETSAFSGNLLTSVVIPSTVGEIASTAFKGNKLEKVEFKGAVSTIDGSAFVSQDVTPAFTDWYTDRSMQPSVLWDKTVPQAMTIYSTGISGYMVTFNTNGGSIVAQKVVTPSESIIAPTAPTRAGYTFAGWYKDSALQTPWNFQTDKVTENITLYAKWNVTSTPGVTSPPASDATSSTPSTTNQIKVDVVDANNPNAVLVQTVITRESTGGVVKDTVNFTSANARESIEKLVNQEKKQSRMVIPDAQQQVSETTIGIAKVAAQLLAEGQAGLGIDMETVKFDIPSSSLTNIDNDIYFRVVPVKAQATKQQLEERAKAESSVQQFTNNATITLLGQPMTIETNMQNRPVTLTLPLPKDVTQEQLDNLAVYIEHSDGTKEVVRGQIVDFKEGTKGIQFDVTKFSTFSILYAPAKEEQPEEEVQVEEEVILEEPVSVPYIQGYPDGTFRPNTSVTRAQMASMLARYLTDNAIPEATATFIDTTKHGAKDAIEFVKETGLLKGTTATTFNPNGTITRAQMATVVARWLAENGEVNASQAKAFKDVKANHWAAKAIAVVSAQGIMTGTSAETFHPDGHLTRAQAVKVLNQLFEREVQASEQAPLFTDVPSNHWAFDEIQAAAQ
ncbi:leucine-rich repeat protein [Lysinibacillus sp. FSL H8-0500]|uniref:leucine-rich repeat protein n=1 Tax=Lysinibacillus sp. FSL H8-0500 TaxID=2921393 RepID=UPI0031014779